MREAGWKRVHLAEAVGITTCGHLHAFDCGTLRLGRPSENACPWPEVRESDFYCTPIPQINIQKRAHTRQTIAGRYTKMVFLILCLLWET